MDNKYLPWQDLLRYLLMIGADVLILWFWVALMSRLGDV